MGKLADAAMALILRRTGCAALAIAISAGLPFASRPVAAQMPAPSSPGVRTSHPAASAGKQHTRKRKSPAPLEAAPMAEIPPAAPPAPNWPVNSHAERANVSWNGRDLSVKASNSTLSQILHDVSTATGLKVEGLAGGSDQRIYGSYGPAAARDVLSELLEGSGYNILMIGDRGEGTPRTLVLTAKARGASAKPAQAQNGDAQENQVEEDLPEEPEQPEPPPDQGLRRPFGGPPQGPGGRAPQEILQELQQRQLIQQQQQEQQLQQQQQEQIQQQPQPDQQPQLQPDGAQPQEN